MAELYYMLAEIQWLGDHKVAFPDCPTSQAWNPQLPSEIPQSPSESRSLEMCLAELQMLKNHSVLSPECPTSRRYQSEVVQGNPFEIKRSALPDGVYEQFLDGCDQIPKD